MIDAGILAGDLYDELTRRGAYVFRVLYFAGGGWQMRIRRKGHFFPGVIVVTHAPRSSLIEIRSKRLWKTLGPQTIELIPFNTSQEAAESISDRVLMWIGRQP